MPRRSTARRPQPKIRPITPKYLSGIGTPLVGTPKSAAEMAFRRRLSAIATIRRRIFG